MMDGLGTLLFVIIVYIWAFPSELARWVYDYKTSFKRYNNEK